MSEADDMLLIWRHEDEMGRNLRLYRRFDGSLLPCTLQQEHLGLSRRVDLGADELLHLSKDVEMPSTLRAELEMLAVVEGMMRGGTRTMGATEYYGCRTPGCENYSASLSSQSWNLLMFSQRKVKEDSAKPMGAPTWPKYTQRQGPEMEIGGEQLDPGKAIQDAQVKNMARCARCGGTFQWVGVRGDVCDKCLNELRKNKKEDKQ